MQKPAHVIEGLKEMAPVAIRARWERCKFHIQPDGVTEPHKTCTKCLNCLPAVLFHKKKGAKFGVAAWCKQCTHAFQKQHRNKSPENIARDRAYKRNYWNHPERKKKFNAASLKKHHDLRQEVLAAYGNVCACCGDGHYEFLAVDHVDPKTKIGKRDTGTRLYRRVRALGFPADFQVLCHNCNMAKGFYGKCPHQKDK